MKNKLNIIASIEARMTSSRLPGKVLMTANGKPLLQIMIERVSKSRLINKLVVATTTNKDDDPIVELCNKLNIKSYRGSEPDVLNRVVKAHEMMKSDIIVELTGDCPLIDSDVIDKTITIFIDGQPDLDYSSSVQYPNRIIPDGMDVEVFKYKDLVEIEKKVLDKNSREHVSPYFFESGLYKTEFLKLPEKWVRSYFLRITLDTLEDYNLIKLVHETLSRKNQDYTLEDILNFFDNNKHLMMINKND